LTAATRRARLERYARELLVTVTVILLLLVAAAAARLRHIAGTGWSTKRYLNIGLLKDHQMRGAITA
jgi:hypothetical protein